MKKLFLLLIAAGLMVGFAAFHRLQRLDTTLVLLTMPRTARNTVNVFLRKDLYWLMLTRILESVCPIIIISCKPLMTISLRQIFVNLLRGYFLWAPVSDFVSNL